MSGVSATLPHVFLLAGEPSADTLGARLMAALRAEAGRDLRFSGIGGPRMVAEGLESLFPMDELAVMGFLEVLPHLRRLARRLSETEAAVRALRPDLLVTIDSPGFNLRLLHRLHDLTLPKIHYVAPQAWAWRPGRAKALARDLDRLLLILPFEPDFFARYGVPATFVGHPIVEELPEAPDAAGFRRAHGIAPETPLVALLPGSRAGVAAAHLPILGDTVARLAEEVPGLEAVIPTVAHVAPAVRAAVADWTLPVTVIEERAHRFDAFAACRVAIASSGTVGLELALARLPFITIYRTNPLTAWLARRLISVPHVNLINLILGRAVVPELLQEDCRPDRILAAVRPLLADDHARAAQITAMDEATRLLGRGAEPPPSRQAARVVLDCLDGGRA